MVAPTHTDAKGLPTVIYHGTDGYVFPYHPTPCCNGTSVTKENGQFYCKACWAVVDVIYTTVPAKPFTPIRRDEG